MKLSLALGKSKREILETFTYDEILDYLAYDQIEPFAMDNWHFAMLGTIIANSNSPKKKFKLKDFYPFYESKTKTTKELLAKAMQINSMFGGTDTRKEV